MSFTNTLEGMVCGWLCNKKGSCVFSWDR